MGIEKSAWADLGFLPACILLVYTQLAHFRLACTLLERTLLGRILLVCMLMVERMTLGLLLSDRASDLHSCCWRCWYEEGTETT